jgi:hypothetical protein
MTACTAWLASLVASRVRIVVPEIADYEVRRELLRLQKRKSLARFKAIDADVILAAQALTIGVPQVVVATTNVGHLSRFVSAELWQNISP